MDTPYTKSKLTQDISYILEAVQETEHDYDDSETCGDCSDNECYDDDYDCCCDCHSEYEGYIHDSARRIANFIMSNIDNINSINHKPN